MTTATKSTPRLWTDARHQVVLEACAKSKDWNEVSRRSGETTGTLYSWVRSYPEIASPEKIEHLYVVPKDLRNYGKKKPRVKPDAIPQLVKGTSPAQWLPESAEQFVDAFLAKITRLETFLAEADRIIADQQATIAQQRKELDDAHLLMDAVTAPKNGFNPGKLAEIVFGPK